MKVIMMHQAHHHLVKVSILLQSLPISFTLYTNLATCQLQDYQYTVKLANKPNN